MSVFGAFRMLSHEEKQIGTVCGETNKSVEGVDQGVSGPRLQLLRERLLPG